MTPRGLDAGTIVLASLLLLHGGIHALGFVKAFGFSDVPALPPVSRTLGVLWLAAGALLVAGAVLRLTGSSAWWMPAAPGLVLSQVAIVTAWGAAKWGTLPNVVLLLPLVIACARAAPSSFESRFHREVRTAAAPPPAPPILQETDLSRLPLVVRNYVRHSGAVGRPRVDSFRARFRGEIRSKPDGPFMPFEAEQENHFDPVARRFLLRSSLHGLPFVAFHQYVGSAATMEVKIADLFRIVDARGPEMDRSETVTVLNDLCVFAPGRLAVAPIAWEELAPLRVKATFENAGHRVSGVLDFDEQGRLVNFHSDDRYQSADGKSYHLYRWSTPLSDYRDFGGVRLPAHGEAIWHMPDGELVYGKFDLLELRYNGTEAGR